MKKQIMSIVLAVSMLASLFAVFMLPAVAADDPAIRGIYVSDNALVVDGKCDDEYLESDKIVSIYSIRDKDPNLKFEGYAVATKEGIYIWLEIKGDTTYVNVEGKNVNDYKSQGENRDYLQVYYNMSASGKDDHKGYVMHDYTNSTYFRNEAGSNKIGYGTTAPAGFQSAAVKTSTGWISEMFIAWAEGSPAQIGMAAGDLTTYFGLGFQYNDDTNGDDKYNTAVYDKNTTSYWSDYKLTCPSQFFRNFGRLSKTNVFLDGDLTLDYKVNLGGANNADTTFVRYTITDAKGVAQSVDVKGTLIDIELDTYKYSLAIAPYRMNDKIKVELYSNGKKIHELAEYTVRDFCINTLNSSIEALKISYNQYAAMQLLAVDVLNFGAMAQQFNKYDVANLANVGYERDFADVEVQYSPVVVSKKAAGFDNVDLVSYNIYFDGESRLFFKVKADAADAANVFVSVYASGDRSATYIPLVAENYNEAEGVYEVYTAPIDPSDYDLDMIVRLEYVKDLGTDWESYHIVQAVKCSVNAYLAEIVATSTNADMVALAKAAYCLGYSADIMSKA